MFGIESEHSEMLFKQSQELIKRQKHMSFFSGLGNFLMTLMLGINLWLVVWVSVGLVNKGVMNGSFIALIALGVIAFYEAIMPLPIAYQYLGKIISAAKRITQLTDQESRIYFGRDSIKIESHNNSIQFNVNIPDSCFIPQYMTKINP